MKKLNIEKDISERKLKMKISEINHRLTGIQNTLLKSEENIEKLKEEEDRFNPLNINYIKGQLDAYRFIFMRIKEIKYKEKEKN